MNHKLKRFLCMLLVVALVASNGMMSVFATDVLVDVNHDHGVSDNSIPETTVDSEEDTLIPPLNLKLPITIRRNN